MYFFQKHELKNKKKIIRNVICFSSVKKQEKCKIIQYNNILNKRKKNDFIFYNVICIKSKQKKKK